VVTILIFGNIKFGLISFATILIKSLLEKHRVESKRKKFIQKLKYKLRLVIINDENFEEKISFKLTPINVFVGLSSFIVLFTILIVLLVFYTPFREFVPGYSDTETKRKVIQLEYKVDSLKDAVRMKNLFMKNEENILSGGKGLYDTAGRESH